jgi:hypothetical protein
MLATVAHGHHSTLIWGIVWVVFGIIHLTFRRFYANRAAAVQDARRRTAPRAIRGMYLNRSRGFYLAMNTVVSAVMLVAGVVLIVLAL